MLAVPAPSGKFWVRFYIRQEDADIGAVAQHIEDADDLLAEAAVLRVHRRAGERHRCDEVGNLNLEALVALGHIGVPRILCR